MVSFTTTVLLVGAIASSVTSQAGASRLLFGMARDGIMPRNIFGYLDPRRATPARSLLLMGAISFVGSVVISFQTVVELVNFGAFVGFMLVNLSVIRHYFIRAEQRRGWDLFRNLILPAAGFGVCALIWANLGTSAKHLGLLWIVIGIGYAAVLTRGFRLQLKEIDIR
jgi:amino acid transporter